MDKKTKIHRYCKGIDMDKGFVYNGIKTDFVIKKGDEFIFDINFDELYCDVIVNGFKISYKSNNHTFNNIPKKIIPIYSHCSPVEHSTRNSSVIIKYINSTFRD